MEHQGILNLLNEVGDSKFVTRKWSIVSDQSNANFDVQNEIIYNTEVLKSNLCDYSIAYILVKGDITVAAAPAIQLSFKNRAPYIECITRLDGTTIDNAEDLDFVMPVYNLIEYSSNYFETTRSLWFYSKGEATNFNAVIANINNFKIFKYKAKLLGNTVAQGTPDQANEILKNATIKSFYSRLVLTN